MQFSSWLLEPDPDPDAAGLGRLHLQLWRESDELRVAYPDLRDREVRYGLVGWLSRFWDPSLPASLSPGGPRDRAVERTADAIGVNVAGYFQSEVGVGEAARRVVRALDAAHVPLLPVQGASHPSSRRRVEHASVGLAAAGFDVNLICVNADGLPEFAGEAGQEFFDGRYTIGMWWWELGRFPDRFVGAFGHVDEVWVGSRFVQGALSAASPVPVVRVPVPVVSPVVVPRTRAELGLPEGFVVLFMFDFHSVMERKNPLGLIDAFAQAFREDDGAHLVIKCVNAEHHPRDAERLRAACSRRSDVHLREEYVTAEVRDAMVAACDCYASLHRSEGFGLTLAEAMALGRPTVATGWSGNVDFMDEETAWLIPSKLVDVGENAAPYDPADRWADPDLAAAAAALRSIRCRSRRGGTAGSGRAVKHH